LEREKNFHVLRYARHIPVITQSFKLIQNQCLISIITIKGNAVTAIKYLRKEVNEIITNAKSIKKSSQRMIRANNGIQHIVLHLMSSIVNVGRSFNMFKVYNIMLRAAMGVY